MKLMYSASGAVFACLMIASIQCAEKSAAEKDGAAKDGDEKSQMASRERRAGEVDEKRLAKIVEDLRSFDKIPAAYASMLEFLSEKPLNDNNELLWRAHEEPLARVAQAGEACLVVAAIDDNIWVRRSGARTRQMYQFQHAFCYRPMAQESTGSSEASLCREVLQDLACGWKSIGIAEYPNIFGKYEPPEDWCWYLKEPAKERASLDCELVLLAALATHMQLGRNGDCDFSDMWTDPVKGWVKRDPIYLRVRKTALKAVAAALPFDCFEPKVEHKGVEKLAKNVAVKMASKDQQQSKVSDEEGS